MAVDDDEKKTSAESDNEVRPRDVIETELLPQISRWAAAELGKARLRRTAPDGSDTYRSVQRGAMALTEGIFAGIRNPLTHEAGQEVGEHVALEYLAALSVLVRWVDESTVESAGGKA